MPRYCIFKFSPTQLFKTDGLGCSHSVGLSTIDCGALINASYFVRNVQKQSGVFLNNFIFLPIHDVHFHNLN